MSNDPQKMFEKLKQISRSNGDTAQSDQDMMRYQIYMQKQAEMFQMIPNMLKMQNDMTRNIINNLR